MAGGVAAGEEGWRCMLRFALLLRFGRSFRGVLRGVAVFRDGLRTPTGFRAEPGSAPLRGVRGGFAGVVAIAR